MRSKLHGSPSCREISTGRGSLLWELCFHHPSFPQGTPQADVFLPLWSLLVKPAWGMVAVLFTEVTVKSHVAEQMVYFSQNLSMPRNTFSPCSWIQSLRPLAGEAETPHLRGNCGIGRGRLRGVSPRFCGTSWCKPALGNQAVGRMLTDLLAGALYVGKHTFSQK